MTFHLARFDLGEMMKPLDQIQRYSRSRRQNTARALKDTYLQLVDVAVTLEAKISTDRYAKAMRSLGRRTLKWLPASKTVDKFIATRQRDQQLIFRYRSNLSNVSVYQIDNTYLRLLAHLKVSVTIVLSTTRSIWVKSWS